MPPSLSEKASTEILDSGRQLDGLRRETIEPFVLTSQYIQLHEKIYNFNCIDDVIVQYDNVYKNYEFLYFLAAGIFLISILVSTFWTMAISLGLCIWATNIKENPERERVYYLSLKMNGTIVPIWSTADRDHARAIRTAADRVRILGYVD